MIFTPNFTIEQSSDGLTLVFTDTSNYDTSSPVVTLADFSARVLTLLDSAGNAIVPPITLGSDLTADIAITADVWVNATLTLTGIAPVGNYTKNLLFPTGRITKNLYRFLNSKGCCHNKLEENALQQADIFFRDSEIAAPSGDGAGWQRAIDAAYAVLYNLQ